MDLYLVKDVNKLQPVRGSRIFSGKHGSRFYNYHKVAAACVSRPIRGWASFLAPMEVLDINDLPSLELSDVNLLEFVISFLETHPCDDSEVVALRSGLVPKITFTIE